MKEKLIKVLKRCFVELQEGALKKKSVKVGEYQLRIEEDNGYVALQVVDSDLYDVLYDNIVVVLDDVENIVDDILREIR